MVSILGNLLTTLRVKLIDYIDWSAINNCTSIIVVWRVGTYPLAWNLICIDNVYILLR